MEYYELNDPSGPSVVVRVDRIMYLAEYFEPEVGQWIRNDNYYDEIFQGGYGHQVPKETVADLIRHRAVA